MATKIQGSQPREQGAAADAASSRVGGSPSLVLRPGEVLRLNPITGNHFIETPRRTSPIQILAKFHVPGLSVFQNGNTLSFEYRDILAIDEADARDAQCRAGWPDTGYGFYEFESSEQGGRHVATWKCAVSCE